MAGVPVPLDTDDLIRRYLAGESCQDLAPVFGVSRETVLRRIKAAGITPRQGPSYRSADTVATLEQRARTREERRLHIGAHEVAFAELLDGCGVPYTQQRAFGPYNVDFALVSVPVAVEVVSGNGNTRSVANRRKRIEHLLDREWWVIEMFTHAGGKHYPLTSGSAEYLVALTNSLSGQPPARGQHRMIRANGQAIAARRRQVD